MSIGKSFTILTLDFVLDRNAYIKSDGASKE